MKERQTIEGQKFHDKKTLHVVVGWGWKKGGGVNDHSMGGAICDKSYLGIKELRVYVVTLTDKKSGLLVYNLPQYVTKYPKYPNIAKHIPPLIHYYHV